MIQQATITRMSLYLISALRFSKKILHIVYYPHLHKKIILGIVICLCAIVSILFFVFINGNVEDRVYADPLIDSSDDRTLTTTATRCVFRRLDGSTKCDNNGPDQGTSYSRYKVCDYTTDPSHSTYKYCYSNGRLCDIDSNVTWQYEFSGTCRCAEVRVGCDRGSDLVYTPDISMRIDTGDRNGSVCPSPKTSCPACVVSQYVPTNNQCTPCPSLACGTSQGRSSITTHTCRDNSDDDVGCDGQNYCGGPNYPLTESCSRCSGDACPPQTCADNNTCRWSVGWSGDCVNGSESGTLLCNGRPNNDSNCPASNKPPTTRSCSCADNNTCRWSVGWSGDCVNGSESGTLLCNGRPNNDSNCPASNKPATSQACCNENSCIKTSQLSTCLKFCGEGLVGVTAGRCVINNGNCECRTDNEPVCSAVISTPDEPEDEPEPEPEAEEPPVKEDPAEDPDTPEEPTPTCNWNYSACVCSPGSTSGSQTAQCVGDRSCGDDPNKNCGTPNTSCNCIKDFYRKAKTPTVTPVANSTTSLKVSWTHTGVSRGRRGYSVFYCEGTGAQCVQPRLQTESRLISRWKQSGQRLSATTTETTITGLKERTQYYVVVINHYDFYQELYHYSYIGDYSDRVPATTNQQCSTPCGSGRISKIASGSVSCSSLCPSAPVISRDSPQYAVDSKTCETTLTMTTPITYRNGTINAQLGTLKQETQTTQGGRYLFTYLLQDSDHGSQMTYQARQRRATDRSTVWSEYSTKSFTAVRKHPGSAFVIDTRPDNSLALQYTPSIPATPAGLSFYWSFSEEPIFHSTTHNGSVNPIVSFSTPGAKTIQLTVTDTTIPGTGSKGCAYALDSVSKQQVKNINVMDTPTDLSLSYLLSNAPQCRAFARISYASTEEERKDVLDVYVGDVLIRSDSKNVLVPSTKSFKFPVDLGTRYKTTITSNDLRRTPTRDPSEPASYTFTTPSATTLPTASFDYTLNPDNSLSLEYTGNSSSIQWSFSESPSYIEGSSTSRSVRVSFPTDGAKKISVSAFSRSLPEGLNACTYSVDVLIQSLFTPNVPTIEEVPPSFSFFDTVQSLFVGVVRARGE